MTGKQITKIISDTPLPKMRIIHVKCRPPEKSDAVLTTKIGGHNWYCERPKYFWSTFDRIFVEAPYLKEQHLLYPDIKETLTVFDDRGLFWAREEMSSFGLVKYFLKHPQIYLAMMATHTQEAKHISETLKKIRAQLSQPRQFTVILKLFIDLYYRMYLAQSTVYMVFDELVYEFRQLLLKYLPKETVNLYFPQFLSGEATKLALAKNYVAERGPLEYSTTRGVLYAIGLRPRSFYAHPRYFALFKEDGQIIESLIQNEITQTDMQKFFAFRSMVPLGFQINEESQYIESQGLSAHLGVLMKAISKKLKIPVEKFQTMTLEQIIKRLR